MLLLATQFTEQTPPFLCQVLAGKLCRWNHNSLICLFKCMTCSFLAAVSCTVPGSTPQKTTKVFAKTGWSRRKKARMEDKRFCKNKGVAKTCWSKRKKVQTKNKRFCEKEIALTASRRFSNLSFFPLYTIRCCLSFCLITEFSVMFLRTQKNLTNFV